MKEQNDSIIKRSLLDEIEVDHSLKKYKDLPLFQKKLDEANKVLKKVGPPKMIKK